MIPLAIVLVSIVLHELAHAWVALRFGDDTPRLYGRWTLMPWAHLHPLGSIVLPAVLLALGLPPVGWAKPMPVAARWRTPGRWIVVHAAGPAMNVLLAILALPLVPWLGWDAVAINMLLAFGNLLPFRWADGGKILSGLRAAHYVREQTVEVPRPIRRMR